MKKDTATKYPNSANLFQFCRRVLDHKFGGIRVIDQDVGQILGFDPADCSHWKKGKKNIRSIQAMKSIAKHLGVDERLVVDVASGEMNEGEAFFEFTGYGDFSPDPKFLETAKKDYYRRNANSWTKDKETEFKRQFETQEQDINRIVKNIHDALSFQEAPLYLPEVVATYGEISLRAVEDDAELDGKAVRFTEEGEKMHIAYPMDEKMRPYVRYGIAKAMGKHFLQKEGVLAQTDNNEQANYMGDVQTNMFAAKLLTPAYLIRKELAGLDAGKDIVAQLADVFWMSKTFMNGRLKEILEKNSEI